MTTIAYVNGILAADTRRTLSPPTTEQTLEHSCPSCGSKDPHISNDVIKLYTNFNTKFDKEDIIAIGASGNTNMINNVIREIRNNFDLLYFFKCFNLLGMNIDYKTENFNLIVITKESAFVFNPTDGLLTYNKNTSLFIGSGADEARVAHRVFKKNAVDSIFVAAQLDKSTGGNVNWIDCNKPDSKIQLAKFRKDFLVKPTKLPIKIEIEMKN